MGGEVNHETGNVTRAWRFRARAFTIYSAAGAIFFGTFAMVTLVMFVSSADVRVNIPMPRQLQIAIMLVMAAMFVIAFILARLYIRYRRVPQLVEKHDGAVCPSCIRPLEPPDNDSVGEVRHGRQTFNGLTTMRRSSMKIPFCGNNIFR